MTGSTRRQFLALCGAAGAAQMMPALATPQHEANAAPLRAEAGSVLLNENAPPTPVWLFDGVAPGPELRGRLGDDLALPIENALPSPIAVRVYGLRGQVARVAIPAGARGVLRATPRDAGTFWYAAEDRLADPRARGLVGAFVVEEREEHAYDVDRDLAIVLDAWPVRVDGRLGFGPVATTLLANGRAGLVEPAHPGERLRLRVINAAPDRRFLVALDGWSGWIIALDGNPLAAVESVARLDLWPGQSADIVVDAPPTFGATTALVDVAAGGPRMLAMFIADGASLDPLDYAPPPLPPRATLP
jgi:FtsP/CotA-like multicopper oxidase with cupredoxin domain